MIRITRLTDYGIVLLSRFAGAEAEAVLSARELADTTGIPLPTVSKILKSLTRSSLLASHRGTQGGYSLARPAGEITVADVIACLEGPIALTDCAGDDESTCDIERRCPVRTNWQRITDAIRNALEAVPITDMTVSFPLHHAPAPTRATRALEAAARAGRTPTSDDEAS